MTWTQVFADTFTDADNTELTAHTPDTGAGWAKLTAASDILISSLDDIFTGAAPSATYAITDALGSAQYAEWIRGCSGNASSQRERYLGIHLAADGGGSWRGYVMRCDGFDTRMFRADAGVLTQLSSAGAGGACDAVHRIERDDAGDLAYSVAGGASVTGLVDATYTDGAPGLWLNTVRVGGGPDDFAAGEWDGGGGSIVLTVADASHGHSADVAALTQANVLAVGDSSHAHAAQNIALNVGVAISVNAADHAHAAESPTLIQSHVLDLAEALHGHTVDYVGLIQANALSPADALHGHTTDGVNLTQASVLSVYESTHDHLAELISLSQSALLIIQQVAHAQQADQIELIQSSVLSAQESTHSHAADGNISLGLQGVLIVSDGVHSHTSDQANLTQSSIISIDDALHSQLVDVVLSLSQGFFIGPNGSVHSHSADSIVLTSQNALQVNDSNQSQTAENTVLTQDNILVIIGSIHDHLVDNISVSIPGVTGDPLERYILTINPADRVLVVNPSDNVLVISS